MDSSGETGSSSTRGLVYVVIAARVAALDTSLFAHVESQTTDGDRKSLLAVHDAIARRTNPFSYLEIGSYRGGTLQVVIADNRCETVVSIDTRPAFVPDGSKYEDNSTARMIELLRSVPGADLTKLVTIEESTAVITPERVVRPDFCLIDGEHTYDAALRDARLCSAVTRGAGVLAFHDFQAIERAVLAFLRETRRPYRAYLLADSVFVVELGATMTLLGDPRVREQLRPRRGWRLANRAGTVDWLLAFHLRRRKRRAAHQTP